MSRRRADIVCPRDPIGLVLDEAARFVGMSPWLFERQVSEGVMPPPRLFGSRRIWEAEELREAFRRRPHCSLHLKPGVWTPHDDAGPTDPYDAAPRA